MPKRTADYREWLYKELTDPEVAANYVNAASEDSEESLLTALRNVAEASKMGTVAKRAKVNRENLYRSLSQDGNPRLATFTAVLSAMGLKLRVEPLIPSSGSPVSSGSGGVYLSTETATTTSTSPKKGNREQQFAMQVTLTNSPYLNFIDGVFPSEIQKLSNQNYFYGRGDLNG